MFVVLGVGGGELYSSDVRIAGSSGTPRMTRHQHVASTTILKSKLLYMDVIEGKGDQIFSLA